MAYSVKGLAIINDSRALLGVSTAGINTALYVGEEILADGASGIITAKGMVVKTGDLNIEDGGDLVIGAGGSITAEGIFLQVDGESVGVATIAPGGNLEVTNIDASGYVRVGAGLTLNGSLSFTGAGAGEQATGITTDLSSFEISLTDLVTASGAKNYVDSKIGGGSVLEVSGDEGVEGSIDLAEDEVLNLEGTANQIVSEVTALAGLNTVTFKLSDELVAPGTLQVTGITTAAGGLNLTAGQNLGIQSATGVLHNISTVGLSTALEETGAASFAVLPTEKAVKDYVDGVAANVTSSANLSLAGDTGTGIVGLATQSLSIVGTSLEVETSASGAQITIGLPDDVTIGSDLIVTDTFGFDGGQAVSVIGTEDTLVDTTAGVATNTSIPTQLAVKTYVDAKVGGNTNAESIDVADNQDNVVYSVPFVSATGAGVSMYSDATQLSYNPSTGLLVAQDFNSLSDIRFKENVETISGATEKLEQIRGVEFDWKNVEGSSVGVIAQEVQALYPQLVTQGEEKLTVNYNGLTGLLIEAVKELSARVQELEGKA